MTALDRERSNNVSNNEFFFNLITLYSSLLTNPSFAISVFSTGYGSDNSKSTKNSENVSSRGWNAGGTGATGMKRGNASGRGTYRDSGYCSTGSQVKSVKSNSLFFLIIILHFRLFSWKKLQFNRMHLLTIDNIV